MKPSIITPTTELRHLSPNHRNQLAAILDIADAWKKLAAVIVKPDQDDDSLLLFTSANVRTLEQQKYVSDGSPTQSLLDYWGTSGKKRATMEILVNVLVKCELYQAADYVCQNVLNIDMIRRKYGNGDDDDACKACVDDMNMNVSELSTKLDHTCLIDVHPQRFVTPTAPIESSNTTCNNDYFASHNLEDDNNLMMYDMSQLAEATNNFDETPLSEGGSKIGQGAFGTVFYFKDKRSFGGNEKNEFAIKRLNIEFEKQFLSELKIMSKLKHDNLLSLCGISISHDRLCLCLVYEFMANGSLLDRLSCSDNTPCLKWETRVSIVLGTARGICHLHTFSDKPFVHRDIKSANVLLDHLFIPKVGDFGLARKGSNGSNGATSTSSSLATTVIGTSVYMAPEAFRGDISVKLDTFSFGVVLLEVLTGLLPYDQHRDEPDLLSYVDEKINDQDEDDKYIFDNLIDKSAGDWNINVAVQLYKLSKTCTEQRKKNRPIMSQVLQLLEQLLNNICC